MPRKLFLFMMVSVDGYFEGPRQDLSWHHVDPEFQAFSAEQLSQIDKILFGYKTFQMMAGFWQTSEALAIDPVTAKSMNEIPKFVVSQAIFESSWNNTTVLLYDNVRDEIQRLKSEPGKDLALFGSNDLCISLIEMGLVDECRLMINPVALGSGRSLFSGLRRPVQLQLITSRQFTSGNLLNCYKILDPG